MKQNTFFYFDGIHLKDKVLLNFSLQVFRAYFVVHVLLARIAQLPTRSLSLSLSLSLSPVLNSTWGHRPLVIGASE